MYIVTLRTLINYLLVLCTCLFIYILQNVSNSHNVYHLLEKKLKFALCSTKYMIMYQRFFSFPFINGVTIPTVFQSMISFSRLQKEKLRPVIFMSSCQGHMSETSLLSRITDINWITDPYRHKAQGLQANLYKILV